MKDTQPSEASSFTDFLKNAVSSPQKPSPNCPELSEPSQEGKPLIPLQSEKIDSQGAKKKKNSVNIQTPNDDSQKEGINLCTSDISPEKPSGQEIQQSSNQSDAVSGSLRESDTIEKKEPSRVEIIQATVTSVDNNSESALEAETTNPVIELPKEIGGETSQWLNNNYILENKEIKNEPDSAISKVIKQLTLEERIKKMNSLEEKKLEKNEGISEVKQTEEITLLNPTPGIATVSFDADVPLEIIADAPLEIINESPEEQPGEIILTELQEGNKEEIAIKETGNDAVKKTVSENVIFKVDITALINSACRKVQNDSLTAWEERVFATVKTINENLNKLLDRKTLSNEEFARGDSYAVTENLRNDTGFTSSAVDVIGEPSKLDKIAKELESLNANVKVDPAIVTRTLFALQQGDVGAIFYRIFSRILELSCVFSEIDAPYSLENEGRVINATEKDGKIRCHYRSELKKCTHSSQATVGEISFSFVVGKTIEYEPVYFFMNGKISEYKWIEALAEDKGIYTLLSDTQVESFCKNIKNNPGFEKIFKHLPNIQKCMETLLLSVKNDTTEKFKDFVEKQMCTLHTKKDSSNNYDFLFRYYKESHAHKTPHEKASLVFKLFSDIMGEGLLNAAIPTISPGNFSYLLDQNPGGIIDLLKEPIFVGLNKNKKKQLTHLTDEEGKQLQKIPFSDKIQGLQKGGNVLEEIVSEDYRPPIYYLLSDEKTPAFLSCLVEKFTNIQDKTILFQGEEKVTYEGFSSLIKGLDTFLTATKNHDFHEKKDKISHNIKNIQRGTFQEMEKYFYTFLEEQIEKIKTAEAIFIHALEHQNFQVLNRMDDLFVDEVKINKIKRRALLTEKNNFLKEKIGHKEVSIVSRQDETKLEIEETRVEIEYHEKMIGSPPGKEKKIIKDGFDFFYISFDKKPILEVLSQDEKYNKSLPLLIKYPIEKHLLVPAEYNDKHNYKDKSKSPVKEFTYGFYCTDKDGNPKFTPNLDLILPDYINCKPQEVQKFFAPKEGGDDIATLYDKINTQKLHAVSKSRTIDEWLTSTKINPCLITTPILEETIKAGRFETLGMLLRKMENPLIRCSDPDPKKQKNLVDFILEQEEKITSDEFQKSIRICTEAILRSPLPVNSWPEATPILLEIKQQLDQDCKTHFLSQSENSWLKFFIDIDLTGVLDKVFVALLKERFRAFASLHENLRTSVVNRDFQPLISMFEAKPYFKELWQKIILGSKLINLTKKLEVVQLKTLLHQNMEIKKLNDGKEEAQKKLEKENQQLSERVNNQATEIDAMKKSMAGILNSIEALQKDSPKNKVSPKKYNIFESNKENKVSPAQSPERKQFPNGSTLFPLTSPQPQNTSNTENSHTSLPKFQ